MLLLVSSEGEADSSRDSCIASAAMLVKSGVLGEPASAAAAAAAGLPASADSGCAGALGPAGCLVRRAGVLACSGACRSGTGRVSSSLGLGSGILLTKPLLEAAWEEEVRLLAAGVGMRVLGAQKRAFSSFSIASLLLGAALGLACACCWLSAAAPSGRTWFACSLASGALRDFESDMAAVALCGAPPRCTSRIHTSRWT